MSKSNYRLNKVLRDIRPTLIKTIHDKKVEEYIESYELINSKKPLQNKVDEFSNVLLMEKVASNEADRMLKEIETAVLREIKKKHWISMGKNTLILGMVINLAIHYIFLYLKQSQGIDLIKGYEGYNFPNFANAIIIILVMIVSYIINLSGKDKFK